MRVIQALDWFNITGRSTVVSVNVAESNGLCRGDRVRFVGEEKIYRVCGIEESRCLVDHGPGKAQCVMGRGLVVQESPGVVGNQPCLDELHEFVVTERLIRQYNLRIHWGWFVDMARDVQRWQKGRMTFEEAAEAVAEVWIEVGRIPYWRLVWDDVKRWLNDAPTVGNQPKEQQG